MKQPCSQHFSKLIDGATVAPFIHGDTPEKSESRRLATLQTLKLRIGELEQRESRWGAAYWSIGYLAQRINKFDPGVSPNSNCWTVVSCVLDALVELAAARVELKKLRVKP